MRKCSVEYEALVRGTMEVLVELRGELGIREAAIRCSELYECYCRSDPEYSWDEYGFLQQQLEHIIVESKIMKDVDGTEHS